MGLWDLRTPGRKTPKPPLTARPWHPRLPVGQGSKEPARGGVLGVSAYAPPFSCHYLPTSAKMPQPASPCRRRASPPVRGYTHRTRPARDTPAVAPAGVRNTKKPRIPTPAGHGQAGLCAVETRTIAPQREAQYHWRWGRYALLLLSGSNARPGDPVSYVDGVCQLLDIVDLSISIVDEGPPCGDVRWRRRGRNGWLSLSLNLFFPFWLFPCLFLGSHPSFLIGTFSLDLEDLPQVA